MSIIKRVARLFRSDIHSILDCLEEPEAVLQESLREMAAEIGTKRRALQALNERREDLDRAEAAARPQREKLAEETELCFQAQDLVLAKSLIRRRLESEKLSAAYQRDQQALQAKAERLQQLLQAQEKELEDVRRQAEAALAAAKLSAPQSRPAAPGASVSDDEVEVAFLRAKIAHENRLA